MRTIPNTIYVNPLDGKEVMIAGEGEAADAEGAPRNTAFLCLIALKTAKVTVYQDVEKVAKVYDRLKAQENDPEISLEDEDFEVLKDKVRKHVPFLNNPLIFAPFMGDLFDQAKNTDSNG